jgi:hypothetical protein
MRIEALMGRQRDRGLRRIDASRATDETRASSATWHRARQCRRVTVGSRRQANVVGFLWQRTGKSLTFDMQRGCHPSG